MASHLLSMVVECHPPPGDRLPGYLVRGWLLARLQRSAPHLADALCARVERLPGEVPEAFEARRRRPRPFTVSPVFREGWFRVTSLWSALTEWLLGLSHDASGPLVVGTYRGAVMRLATDPTGHPLAMQTTAADLAGWAMTATGLPAAVRLSFDSPTLFSGPRGTGNTVLPEPRLLFESLADAWSAHSGLPLEPDRVSELTDAAQLRTFDLREDGMAGPNHDKALAGRRHLVERGFVGWAEFGLGQSASPESLRLLHMLAAFARFSGVGARTTHGFGQTVPLMPLATDGGRRAAARHHRSR